MSVGQIIVLILLAFFTPAGIVLTVLYFKYRHLLCFTWHGSWQGFGKAIARRLKQVTCRPAHWSTWVGCH